MEWLRSKLESLESSLLRASGSPPKARALAAAPQHNPEEPGGGGGGGGGSPPLGSDALAADATGVLEAARAAVESGGASNRSPGGSPTAAAAAAGAVAAAAGGGAAAPAAGTAGEEQQEGEAAGLQTAAGSTDEALKPLLIERELLRDPSDLSPGQQEGAGQGAAGQQPPKEEQQPGEQEAVMETMEALQQEVPPGQLPDAGLAPAASLSSEIEGLPAGESVHAEGGEGGEGGLAAIATDAAVDAGGVVATVTVVPPEGVVRPKAVAWVAGSEGQPGAGGEREGRGAEEAEEGLDPAQEGAITAAVEKLLLSPPLAGVEAEAQ